MPKTKPNLTAKTAVAKPARGTVKRPAQTTTEPTKRRIQVAKRVWYKPLTWGRRQPLAGYKQLPKARKLFATVIRQIWRGKRLFIGIIIIYALLNLLLVRTITGAADLSAIKATYNSVAHGTDSTLLSSITGFSYLLSTASTADSAQAGIYQVIVFLLCSLAFIWAFRQVIAGQAARIRDSFYQGMYPLIPYILIFLLGMAQLLPLTVGAGLYSAVIGNGIAVHLWEKLLWLLLFLVAAAISLRMVTATIFAAYIVTLPDMTPLRAYRSARQLVRGRRLLVWRKIIFLPFALIVSGIVFVAPFIMLATPVAPWAFFAFSTLTLPIVHGYLYGLYRELL